MRFHLAAPAFRRLEAGYRTSDGKAATLELKLRVYTLEDLGVIIHDLNKGNENWFERVCGGDTKLGIAVLANQVENRAEIETLIGQPLRETLPRVMLASGENMKGLVVTLDELKTAMTAIERKKKLLAALRSASIGLLLIFCGAAATALAVWKGL